MIKKFRSNVRIYLSWSNLNSKSWPREATKY